MRENILNFEKTYYSLSDLSLATTFSIVFVTKRSTLPSKLGIYHLAINIHIYIFFRLEKLLVHENVQTKHRLGKLSGEIWMWWSFGSQVSSRDIIYDIFIQIKHDEHSTNDGTRHLYWEGSRLCDELNAMLRSQLYTGWINNLLPNQVRNPWILNISRYPYRIVHDLIDLARIKKHKSCSTLRAFGNCYWDSKTRTFIQNCR